MDIALIIILILINGLFAMSEMALVSANKVRLEKLARQGRASAETALRLHEQPSRFLSTVQVGITSVGILSGALGENALTTPLVAQLNRWPELTPYAESIALVITVSVLTYFSVVIGELVPKRLALQRPERISLAVAKPMNGLALIASPLVWLLSSSSNVLLRVLRAQNPPQATITNEEISILMDIGSESGVFHASERRLVSNVLKLDEQRVGAIMTPSKDMFVIDLNDDNDKINELIANCPYSRTIVCHNGLENVLGILHRSDLIKLLMAQQLLDISRVVRPALYVPDSLTLPRLLEFFREKTRRFCANC
ncbi:hemolysin family protein [Methylocucumis oryzae]|uniref:hemolysin family protein n=1 Tax=Methylocucumis oryzae TaxID=1632867 RepID=UPI000A5A10C8|nr:hemolysin family protein [Methylocucumis oryzae]